MPRHSMYSDVRVVCPFYEYTINEKIICESYGITCRSKEDTSVWKKKHCELMKSSCPVRQKLMKEYQNE